MVTKFTLPTLDDLKLLPIKYDKDCNYIQDLDDQDDNQIKQNIKDLLMYCAKLRPYMAFYKMQIKAHNATVHHIFKNEVDLILPKVYTHQKNKRGIFSAIITRFIGLAFEGISSFLHHKRHKALHKAVKAMSISMGTCNKYTYAFGKHFGYVQNLKCRNFGKFSKNSSCFAQ